MKQLYTVTVKFLTDNFGWVLTIAFMVCLIRFVVGTFKLFDKMQVTYDADELSADFDKFIIQFFMVLATLAILWVYILSNSKSKELADKCPECGNYSIWASPKKLVRKCLNPNCSWIQRKTIILLFLVFPLFGFGQMTPSANQASYLGHPGCAPGERMPLDAAPMSWVSTAHECPFKGSCSWGASDTLHICRCHFTYDHLYGWQIDIHELAGAGEMPYITPTEYQIGYYVVGNTLRIRYDRNGAIGIRIWYWDTITRTLRYQWANP